MKGSNLNETANLLTIDGIDNKEEIMVRARKYKEEHGEGNVLVDGNEGPRIVPRSATLASVLTNAMIVKTLELKNGKQMQQPYSIYPVSVLLPLCNAAVLDLRDGTMLRTSKFPLLPYEKNKYFLAEDEKGMTTFDTGHSPFFRANQAQGSQGRHQGKEFTL